MTSNVAALQPDQGSSLDAGQQNKEERGHMGRPEKQPHEKLSEVVMLRLTLAEREHVRDQAASAGVTVSDYLRRRACGYMVPRATQRPGANPALISELNRIGVNLNQIARNLNSDRSLRLDPDEILAELLDVLARVASGEILEHGDLAEGVG